MHYVHWSVLSLWLYTTLHTILFSALCFWYSKPPDSAYETFHCWFPHLFCLRPLYMEWPSLPCPTETVPGLFQIQPQVLSLFQNQQTGHIFRSALLPSCLSCLCMILQYIQYTRARRYNLFYTFYCCYWYYLIVLIDKIWIWVIILVVVIF